MEINNTANQSQKRAQRPEPIPEATNENDNTHRDVEADDGQPAKVFSMNY